MIDRFYILFINALFKAFKSNGMSPLKYGRLVLPSLCGFLIQYLALENVIEFDTGFYGIHGNH